MNITKLPKDYHLLTPRHFSGEIMSPNDTFIDDHTHQPKHLLDEWRLLKDAPAVDRRWRFFSTFAEDAQSIEGYVGIGRHLTPTYYGSNVYSRDTCVWSAVEYSPICVLDGDDIYFDTVHYEECTGKVAESHMIQSSILLRRRVC